MAEKDFTLKFKVTDEGTVVLDKISQKITGMDKSVKGVSSSLSLIKWDSIVNLGARAINAGEQVYDFARSIATSANEIKRQAEIMGLSTDAYQKLSYAAKMADVDNERFASGMKFLARSIEEAKAGTGDAGKYFKALGIDVDKLSDEDLKLENMTYRLADAFQSVEQGTGKTAVAIGLMGRSGQELVPYFNLGAKAIKDLGEEAVKLGTVLGDVIIGKGSEAEDTFKRLEATINALKISFAPAANVLANFFSEGLQAAKDFFNLIKKIPGFGGVDFAEGFGKAMYFKSVDDLLAYTEKMAKKMGEIKIDPKQFADPEGIKRAQSLMHEWLSEYQIDIDELNQSMSVLGTKSTQSLMVGIKDAENAVSSITAKFRAGKVSVLDYANSIKSLTESYKKMAGEDTFGNLNDAMDTYLEKVKQLNEQYPERGQEYQKALSKAVDEWLKKKTEIEEKDPVFIRANLSKWEEDLREAKRQYDAFAASIEPVSITGTAGSGGNVNTSEEAGTPSLAPPKRKYGGSYDANLTNKLYIDFVGTGMSPPMPLGEAFDKLGNKISNVENDLSALNFAIDFSKITNGLGSMGVEANKLNAVLKNWMYLISMPGGRAISTMMGGMGQENMKMLSDQMGEVLDKVFEEELNLLTEYITMTGKELTPKIWDRFIKPYEETKFNPDVAQWYSKFSYQDVKEMFAGSYQHGTTYVPKTGFALVHEGERIVSKNQTTNMGGINITVSGSGDPVKVANEIAKVLKYGRSSQLREAING